MNGRSSNVWPLACWCMPNIHQFMLSAHLVLIEPKRNQMVDELAKENRFFCRHGQNHFLRNSSNFMSWIFAFIQFKSHFKANPFSMFWEFLRFFGKTLSMLNDGNFSENFTISFPFLLFKLKAVSNIGLSETHLWDGKKFGQCQKAIYLGHLQQHCVRIYSMHWTSKLWLKCESNKILIGYVTDKSRGTERNEKPRPQKEHSKLCFWLLAQLASDGMYV